MEQPNPVRQRKRGRPRVQDPLSPVSTRLPTRHHDRLVRLANRRGESVSETVRQVIILTLSGFRLNDDSGL
jgi:hypothetical protein